MPFSRGRSGAPSAALRGLRRKGVLSVPVFVDHAGPFATSWRTSGRGFVSTGLVRLRIHPRAHVTIGSNVRINSGYGSNFVGSGQRTCIYVGRDAHLCVGSDVGLSNSVLICTKQISIGDGCLIGGDCLILDSDLHALPIGSDYVRAAEVKIDSRVFLGARCIVLKGVHIPFGVVCGAGSVLRRKAAAPASADATY